MWSVIEETPIYLEKLKLLVDSEKVLQAAAYVLHPLGTELVESKKRCVHCGARVSRRRKVKAKPTPSIRRSDVPDKQITASTEHAGQTPGVETSSVGEATGRLSTAVAGLQVDDAKESRKPACRFHPGRVLRKQFQCCQQHVSSEGCTAHEKHTSKSYPEGELLREWMFYPTPKPEPLSESQQLSRPVPDHMQAYRGFLSATAKRKAVALDCEMGTAKSGETELIRLTLIDFFGGEKLIDSLVIPSVSMSHYNTKYSGVSAADMRAAENSGSCIWGRDAAREQVWAYVGPETIVIMHGGSGDLSALRWIHSAVIDSFLLERFNLPIEGGKSLKNLSLRRLGQVIQSGKGHDSFEDALACRELVHWHSCQIPD